MEGGGGGGGEALPAAVAFVLRAILVATALAGARTDVWLSAHAASANRAAKQVSVISVLAAKQLCVRGTAALVGAAAATNATAWCSARLHHSVAPRCAPRVAAAATLAHGAAPAAPALAPWTPAAPIINADVLEPLKSAGPRRTGPVGCCWSIEASHTSTSRSSRLHRSSPSKHPLAAHCSRLTAAALSCSRARLLLSRCVEGRRTPMVGKGAGAEVLACCSTCVPTARCCCCCCC